jgi:ABC-type transport system involved in cytochrome c biogenesis ATPase subunit
MDGLTGYHQRRLELADMIRAVLPIAHTHGDEQPEQEIRTLLTRLAAGRFQLAVIGQTSRGKTTLMNALLGEAYLPTGALPMTSVVTTVRHGTRARALVRSHAPALPMEVPVAEVARFVAREFGSCAQCELECAQED